ncbi:S-layer homology domain-containing protein [Syntrophomonas curvata]
MNSRRRSHILSLLMLLGTGLFFLVPPACAASFEDLQGHWASEAIYHASVLDLVSGYPDGDFKPEQSLSQMESLVLFMRAAGYDPDKGNKTDKKTPVTKAKIPQVSWGQNYLNQAVRDNLITEQWLADFDSDTPASRAQTADLLCRLLQLPPGEISGGLSPFSDLNQAVPELRPAIIAVARAGIITGYQNGSFYPGNNLKRGEAASILDRLMQDNWLKITAAREVEGWVERIDFKRSPPEIEIQSLQGNKKYKLSPEVKCFKNGKECPYQQTLFWRVKLYLDSKKQVGCISLLEKKSSGQENKITGTVRAVALGNDSFLTLVDLDGRERILPLSWGAELDNGGKSNAKGFQALKANTFVDAYLVNEEVSRVAVLDTKSLSGSVCRVTGKRLDLDSKGSGKKPLWFNYWDRARIIDKNGHNNGVIRGDKVKITYLDPDPGGIDDEIPLEIIITSRPEWKKISGEVEKTGDSYEGRQLVLKKNKSYILDGSAAIYRENGSSIDFNSVKTGDKVEAMLDGAGIVMKLTVMDPKVKPAP